MTVGTAHQTADITDRANDQGGHGFVRLALLDVARVRAGGPQTEPPRRSRAGSRDGVHPHAGKDIEL